MRSAVGSARLQPISASFSRSIDDNEIFMESILKLFFKTHPWYHACILPSDGNSFSCKSALPYLGAGAMSNSPKRRKIVCSVQVRTQGSTIHGENLSTAVLRRDRRPPAPLRCDAFVESGVFNRLSVDQVILLIIIDKYYHIDPVICRLYALDFGGTPWTSLRRMRGGWQR